MKELKEYINESLLDDDILDKYSHDNLEKMEIWDKLCGYKSDHEEVINYIYQYIKDHNIKALNSSKNTRKLKINPNSYYILIIKSLVLHKVTQIGLSKGDELIYTWHVPKIEDKTNLTRFVGLRASMVVKNTFFKEPELYELPKEFIWLYDMVKKNYKKK